MFFDRVVFAYCYARERGQVRSGRIVCLARIVTAAEICSVKKTMLIFMSLCLGGLIKFEPKINAPTTALYRIMSL
jgi:hypothetical protein